MLADFLSTSAAWCVFNLVRYYTLPMNYQHMDLGAYLSMPIVILGQVLFPIMMLCLYAVSGFYNKIFFKSRLDGILNAMGWAVAGSLIIFFSVLFNDKIDDRLGNLEMIVLLWLLLAFFPSVPRLIISNRLTAMIWDRKIAFRAIIVGTSPRARQLAIDLQDKYRSMGFQIVGFANISGDSGIRSKLDGLPVTTLDGLNANEVDAYILVPEHSADAIEVINALLPSGRPVYITPDTIHLITSRPRTTTVAGQVLIDLSRARIPESTVNLKRISDVVLSSIALVVLSPVFAVLAILIKRDSPGPVFYRQERIGYKKQPFKICKLRTMRIDAEAAGPALSSASDPRVTNIGRMLRKYRLDELPQFWNVLKGEMSLVGPRPERAYYLDQIVARAPYYCLVHQVRPGITSWGMVKYGYASNVDQMLERMQYDLLYIDNISLAVDLKILFYTVRTVLTGQGV